MRATRSVANDYNLLSKIQIFLESNDAEVRDNLEAHRDMILTLVKGSQSLEVVDSSAKVPPGCAVSSQPQLKTNIHVLVKGLVDIDREVSNLDKKIEVNRQARERAVQMTQKDEWSKAPEEVKQQQIEKIKTFDEELGALEAAKKNFEIIRGD